MTSDKPSVVVFGSLHYDIVVKGPGRPSKGETVAGTGWYPKCGGKGANQAVAAARHGVTTTMIGAVADDDFGRTLAKNLAANGVDSRFIRTVDGSSTGMSVAIFDSEGDYGAVIVSGSNLSLSQIDVDAARDVFQPGSILLLQNEVPEASNIAAAKAMKLAGGKVLINAAPARALPIELIGLIDILVVNAVEAEILTDRSAVKDLAGAKRAAALLAKTYPTVIVTAGGAGAACVTAEGAAITVPAIKVKLVSTHGAGDEFIGALASGLVQGRSVREALEEANAAAALLVGSNQ